MIPILYDKYDLSDFTSTGYGALTECISCEVTEEVNGIYEMTFQYPTTGRLFSRMANFGGVVACTHDHSGDVQLFDINKYDAPINGVVTFYASHVSYRLRNFFYLGSGSKRTVDSYFSRFNDEDLTLAFAEPHRFTFTNHTNYTTTGVILSGRGCNLRAAIYERESEIVPLNGDAIPQCLLQLWDGEFVFDRFNVDFYTRRGTNRGVQIRYGKNMTDAEREKDWSGTFSVAYAIWANGNIRAAYGIPAISSRVETESIPWETILTQNPRTWEQVYCNSEPMEFRPMQANANVLDLSEILGSDGDAPTNAEVTQYLRDYMSKNSTWRAFDNITVDLADIYDTDEYRNFGVLEDCRVGDFVSVYYSDIGIATDGVEIMSLTYDVLKERVSEMQLSDIKTTLAQVIIDSIGGKK